MGQGKFKRRRNQIKNEAAATAEAAALTSHEKIIERYIDGIIELPYWRRRKVCKAIMRKRNPFNMNKKYSKKRGEKK